MESVLSSSLRELAEVAINKKLILQGISWEFYEQISEEYKESNALHFAYDDGFLEVEMPLLKHEVPIRLLSDLVSTICVELEIGVRNVGSTTFRKQAKSKGCEPDTAFYIQNERKIRGLEEIDLSKNPPPDLVIEVDVTSPSLNKFPIYAALGVSEIWVYKNEQIEFYKLYGEFYQEIKQSIAFPMLSSDEATGFLQSGITEDYAKWIRGIRKWVNER